MKKTAILTFTFLSLAIIPAVAQVKTGGLGQVWTDFQSYSTDLQDYLQNNLSDNLKRDEVQSRLNSAKGELNIPNPVVAGKEVRDDLINNSYRSDSKSNRFENNSAVRGNLVSNELNRVISRGAAESVLGRNGQIRTKAKLENTEENLENLVNKTEELDRKSDNLLSTIVTQVSNATNPADKAISTLAELLGTSQLQTLKIQQEQLKLVGETFAQTLQNNQSLQYSNLNLANISQQAEEANRARRVDTSTEAARLLRATSQIDLFGRKVDN
ncbi:hypothetical protein [Nostoc sp.]|uniref:hypothetical protein n=1 Tax=Nostoc sp. TaxID=1180 RepID=UPI00359407EB